MNSERSIEELIRESMPNTIVSHYIVVAEVIGENGPTISVGMSDNMTPWLALGMLTCGMDMVQGGVFGEDDDE